MPACVRRRNESGGDDEVLVEEEEGSRIALGTSAESAPDSARRKISTSSLRLTEFLPEIVARTESGRRGSTVMANGSKPFPHFDSAVDEAIRSLENFGEFAHYLIALTVFRDYPETN